MLFASMTRPFPFTSVLIHLSFPDGASELELVDKIACCIHGISSVLGGRSDYHTDFADGHNASSMIYGNMLQMPLVSSF